MWQSSQRSCGSGIQKYHFRWDSTPMSRRYEHSKVLRKAHLRIRSSWWSRKRIHCSDLCEINEQINVSKHMLEIAGGQCAAVQTITNEHVSATTKDWNFGQTCTEQVDSVTNLYEFSQIYPDAWGDAQGYGVPNALLLFPARGKSGFHGFYHCWWISSWAFWRI